MVVIYIVAAAAAGVAVDFVVGVVIDVDVVAVGGVRTSCSAKQWSCQGWRFNATNGCSQRNPNCLCVRSNPCRCPPTAHLAARATWKIKFCDRRSAVRPEEC